MACGFFSPVTGWAQFTYEESFRGADAGGWDFTAGSTSPGPRLTAGSLPVGADPEVAEAPIDPEGQGWLRLTTRTANQANSAVLKLAIPSDGTAVTFEFDFAMWSTLSGTPADGISVFLADANVPFNPGAFGGSLGYANRSGADGLSGGMVGVGFDVWGNFTNSAEARNGGFNDTALRKNEIAVRGQGQGVTGYEYVGSTVDGSGTLSDFFTPGNDQLDFSEQDFRPDQDAEQFRRTRVTIDENNLVTVWVEFGFGTGFVKVLDELDISAVPGWTGRPEELVLGFTGGTGGSNQIYEVRNLSISLDGGASSFYWDNEAGDNAWQTGGNWDGDTVPSVGASVFFSDQFADTDSAQTVQLNGDRTIGSAFFGGEHSYTLETGTLVMEALGSLETSRFNIVKTPTGVANHTIASDLRLENNLEINHFTKTDFLVSGNVNLQANTIFSNTAVGATTELSGVVSGSGALNKLGEGTTILSGASSYTGATGVEGGILEIRSDSALGSAVAGTTVESGATLGLGGNITVTGEALTISGAGLDGAGALRNLDGANEWTGAISLNADSTIGADANSDLTLSGNILGGGNDATFVTGAGGTILIDGTISGAGTDVVFAGEGTSEIGFLATNTYTGTTVIRSGTVLSNSSVGAYSEDAFGNSASAIQFGDAGTGAGDDISLLFNTTASGGAGAWPQINADRAFDINNFGNTVTVGAVGESIFEMRRAINLNRDLNLFADTDSTFELTGFGGQLTGTGNLTKTGAGELILTGNNTYAGDFRVEDGTVTVGSATDALDDGGRVTMSDSATALLNIQSTETIGSLAGGGATGGNVNVATGTTLTSGADNTSTTFSGALTGTGDFAKTGTGTMTFDGTSTMTGSLVAANGIVALGADNAFASGMDLALNGGTFVTNGFSDTMGDLIRNSSSAFDYSGIAGSALTFSSATGSGTVAVENWIGNLLGGGDSQLIISSAGAPANLANINFLGWGTGAQIVGGPGSYELVPSLSGFFEWDGNGSNADIWRNSRSQPWVSNSPPPDSTPGTKVLFGGAAPGPTQTVSLPQQGGGDRTVGSMVVGSNGGPDYSFRSGGNNQDRILTFDNGGGNDAYLTIVGDGEHVIGSTSGARVNILLNADTRISNNSTGSIGLTLGQADHTFDTNGNTAFFSGAGTTLVNSQILGGGAIVKNGTGVLRLTQNNTFSGGTTLNAGTIQIGNDGAFSTSALTINGGTLDAFGGDRSLANGFTVNDDFAITGGSDRSLNLNGAGVLSAGNHRIDVAADTSANLFGAISGSGGLTKTGAGGLFTYDGNNSFSGPVNVEAGTLYGIGQTANDFTFGATVAGQNLLGTGTEFTVSGGEGGVRLESGGNLTLASNAVLNSTGGVTNFQNFDPTAPATLDDFQFDATANVSGGAFNLGSTQDMTFGAGAVVNASGGASTFLYGRDFTTAGTGGDPAVVNVSGDASVTFLNANAGDATFAQGANDTINVTGPTASLEVANTGAGANTANFAGTLNLLNNGTLSIVNTSTTVASTALVDGGNASTAGTMLLRDSDLTVDPTAEFVNAPNVAFDTTGSASIFGTQPATSIKGIGTLSVEGGGTVTIDTSVNNIDANLVDIRGGTLMLGDNNQIANSSNMRLSGDSVFNTNNNNEVLGTLTLSGNSSVDLGSDALDGSILRFAGSSGTSWAASQALVIDNWNGSADGGGTDQIFFGNTAGGLTTGQLSQIVFVDPFGPGSGTFGARILPSGEIVPVPEPAAIAAGIGLVGLIAWRERKRLFLLIGNFQR